MRNSRLIKFRHDKFRGEVVHCEFALSCKETDCIHYEPHEYGEAEALLPSGTIIKSPCTATRCLWLKDGAECECVPIRTRDEEDIA